MNTKNLVFDTPKKLLKELVVGVKRGFSSYYFSPEGSKTFLINIAAIHDGKVDIDKAEEVRLKETFALEKSRIQPNDVILTIKGSAFKAAVAGPEVQGFVISSNLIAFTLNNEILPEFVASYLNSPEGQNELQSKSVGAAQQSINLKSLMEVTIPILPLEKQKLLAKYFSLAREYFEISKAEQELMIRINNAILKKHLGGEK